MLKVLAVGLPLLLVAIVLIFLPGCDKMQTAGKVPTLWALTQLGKLNTNAATGSAVALKASTTQCITFLQSDGAKKTAGQVNHFLIECLLKNVNPAVAAGIDTAAAVLDNVLQVPADQLLTESELGLLIDFVKGVQAGSQAYLDGKVATKAPDTTKAISNKPRRWLRQ